MKIDTSIWNNGKNLRDRVKNLATMLLTLSIINIYVIIGARAWFILVINVIYILATIPIWLSWLKWQKEPPQEVIFENERE